MFYGNTPKEWLVALAILAGSIVISRVFYFISTKGIKRIFKKARSRFMYIMIDMLEEPVALLIIIIGFYYSQRRLAFDAPVDALVGKVVLFVVILTMTWAISRLLNDLISQFVVPMVERSESKLDDQLLPILRTGGKWLVWILGIIIALDNIGYDVGTIVAGLGIGGLAFAFAAQETISNIFGGVTIFINAPFRIGDRIRINGYDGWVREVGMHSAKLETLDGRRLTMPNAMFSKNVIENVSSEPATRVIETVGLACSQNSAIIERAIALIKEIESNDPGLAGNSTVWFSNFGDSSWNLTVVLWICKDADYAETISRANISIVKALEKAGIEFSLPTRAIVQAK